MQNSRDHAPGRLSTVALAVLAVVWAANVEAMPPVRALVSQSAYAGFQDYEEEVEDEGEGDEEYADEADDSGEEEYADEADDSGEEEDDEAYADEEDESAEEDDSGEEDVEDVEDAEEAFADDEDDSAEEDSGEDDEVASEDDDAGDEFESGEEAGDGEDADLADDSDPGEYDDATADDEVTGEDDPEAYADEYDTEYVDDYEDDSWAPEYVEVESDDAIPIDEETWGEDVVWEVVEVEEVDGSGSVDEDTVESDEDSVGAGELMVVRSAKRTPSSRPGSRPAPRPGSKPAGSADDDQDTPYSFGGRPVSALSVPWQAQIFNPKGAAKPSADGKPPWQRQHYCGGALIARDWVLTAAHCIDQQLVDYGFKVRLGMTDLSKGDGLTYRIDRIVRHSQYNADNNDPAKPPNMYANDIALIHIVDDGAPQRRDPKRIREIPLNRQALTPGVPVSATGWGVTGTGDADVASAVILRVDLQLMATPVCQARPKFGPQKIHGNVFCAANPQRSTCRGDSGGPVVLTNKAPVLVGVVSWGKRKCSGDGRPGVYTRVDRYLDWIDKAMKLPPNKTALP